VIEQWHRYLHRSINGGESKVGGTGPMTVRAKSGELIIDPDGLYLKPGKDQPNFRVISTQRLNTNGVWVVGCFKGTNQDVMQDRTTKHTINLAEDGQPGKKILVLETVPCPSFANRAVMKRLVEQIRRRNVSAKVPRFNEIAEMKEARIWEMHLALQKKKISRQLCFSMKLTAALKKDLDCMLGDWAIATASSFLG
jgi:hypothetical protein